MSVANSDTSLQIAALGRPFELGQLFDCTNEKQITGVTLWSPERLKNFSEINQSSSNFMVEASNKLSDKANMFSLSASMKLSFFSGLISVSGSAKYLQESHASMLEERISCRYKLTTCYKHLNMDQLAGEKIQFPEILTSTNATHVVTGITYGGNAIFEFKRDKTDGEERKEVSGKLKAVVNKIPTVSINAEGALDLTADEKKIAESFSCRFTGDCILKKSPSNFKEAVTIYRDLPSYLKESPVPVEIFLEPLSSFGGSSEKLLAKVSSDVMRYSIDILEELDEIVQNSEEFLTHCTDMRMFESVVTDLESFKEAVEGYLANLKGQFSDLLPKVRSGEKKESMLLQIIDTHRRSPFRSDVLQKWLTEKATEVKIFKQYLSRLSGAKICRTGGDLKALILNPENSLVFCFTFKRSVEDDTLRDLLAYQANKPTRGEWKESQNSRFTVVELVNLFHKFVTENKDEKGVVFAVSEYFSDDDSPPAFLQAYKDGRCIEKSFLPPSEPGKPKAKRNRREIMHIEWAPPKAGSFSSYEVYTTLKDFQHHFKTVVNPTENESFDQDDSYGYRFYEVKVRAMFHSVPGPFSEPFVFPRS